MTDEEWQTEIIEAEAFARAINKLGSDMKVSWVTFSAGIWLLAEFIRKKRPALWEHFEESARTHDESDPNQLEFNLENQDNNVHFNKER